jgi:hypothetical protein
MSQLLLVQGAEAGVVQPVFGALLALFESASGIHPTDQLCSSGVAVAKFPMLQAPASGIVRNPGTGTWACAAGVPFRNGASCGADLDTIAANWNSRQDAITQEMAEVEGSFLLALGNRAGNDCAYVVTDRLGTLHAYTAEINSCTVISTSSLVLAALLQPEWHPDSCREFLASGTVFGNRSLFRGITKLPPATVLVLRKGRIASQFRYWDLPAVMNGPALGKKTVPALAEALVSSVRSISARFPSPVFDLTGGYDSRVVIAAMQQVQGGFNTVVVGPPRDPDVLVAGRIAGALGLRHQRLENEPDSLEAAGRALPLCDGEYDLFTYGRILGVHTRLAGQFDASVNGSNGEIAKGYWWELLLPHIGRRDHFDPNRIADGRFSVWGEPPGLLAAPFGTTLTEHFAGLITEANRDFEHHLNTAKMDNVYLTLRMQHWQGRLASATSRLWPCLSPFMWRRPMEVILSAPPEIRVRHRLSTRLIEYLNPALAALPLAQGYPALPLRLSTAHRFWPLARQVGGKVFQRLTGKRAEEAPEPATWYSEEVREILQPAAMLTRSLYLEKPLAQALGTASGYPAAWLRRILTVELLARKVRSSQRATAAGGLS